MERYKTKQDVVTRFGLPTEKRTGEGIEEWIYNFGTTATSVSSDNSTTRTDIYNTYNGVSEKSNTNTSNVSQYKHYNMYVKFTFQGDQVLRWDSQAMDYSETKKSMGRTVLATAGVVAVLVAFTIYAAKPL